MCYDFCFVTHFFTLLETHKILVSNDSFSVFMCFEEWRIFHLISVSMFCVFVCCSTTKWLLPCISCPSICMCLCYFLSQCLCVALYVCCVFSVWNFMCSLCVVHFQLFGGFSSHLPCPAFFVCCSTTTSGFYSCLLVSVLCCGLCHSGCVVCVDCCVLLLYFCGFAQLPSMASPLFSSSH